MVFSWPDDWPSFDDIQIPLNPEQWLKDRVIEILNYLGYEWPKTSENVLDQWAAQWSGYVAEAEAQIATLERSLAQVTENNAGPVPDAVAAYMASSDSNLNSLRSMASAAPKIAEAYQLAAGLIRTLRAVVIGKILLDAISLAAAIISGGASAAVTVLVRTGASVGINRLFTNQGVGSVVGVCGVAAGWRGRGLPKMKVPTRLIWKTSTCPTLPSLPLV